MFSQRAFRLLKELSLINPIKGQKLSTSNIRTTIYNCGRIGLIGWPLKLVDTNLSFIPVAKCSSGTKIVDEMSANEDYKNAKSIYDFTVKDTYGNEVSLDKYKGNVVLVVNIASQCGLTKNNYAQITELKEKYHDKGLRVLSFPCNQFNSQSPEADGEAMVCSLRDAKADVGDVFAKIDVNGANAHPLYQYLKHKQSGTFGNAIKWNFTKFLVNKEGIPVNRYAPTTEPKDIVKDIEKLL